MINDFIEEEKQIGSELEAFQRAFFQLESRQASSFEKNKEIAQQVSDFFKGPLSRHCSVEKKVVFPFLRKHIPRLGTILDLFLHEYREAQSRLRLFQRYYRRLCLGKNSQAVADQLRNLGLHMICLLHCYWQAKEDSLYQAIHQLNPSEKKSLERRVKRVQDTVMDVEDKHVERQNRRSLSLGENYRPAR